jgi:hypothetical protein
MLHATPMNTLMLALPLATLDPPFRAALYCLAIALVVVIVCAVIPMFELDPKTTRNLRIIVALMGLVFCLGILWRFFD